MIGRIALAAVGDVSDDVMTTVRGCIRETFGAKTRIVSRLPPPEYAWDPARRQHSSTHVLRELSRLWPQPEGKLLGVFKFGEDGAFFHHLPFGKPDRGQRRGDFRAYVHRFVGARIAERFGRQRERLHLGGAHQHLRRLRETRWRAGYPDGGYQQSKIQFPAFLGVQLTI